MLTQGAALRKDRINGVGTKLEHRHFAFIAATIKGLGLEGSELCPGSALASHFTRRYSSWLIANSLHPMAIQTQTMPAIPLAQRF